MDDKLSAADEIRGDKTRIARLKAGVHRGNLSAGMPVDRSKVEAAIRFLEEHEEVLDVDMIAELQRLIARHEQ
ncbi:MAG: hypothetical protein WCP14_01355 [bacterium]